MTTTEDAPAEAVAPEPADEVAVRRRGPRPSPLVLLASAILVAVIAQVVMSWLSLGAITQVRDQSAVANGLQRCLIQAQLSATSTSDTTGAAYRTAVQACLNK
jgi:glucose-6-phosphate dehydrogenase assembly protein OpcA